MKSTPMPVVKEDLEVSLYGLLEQCDEDAPELEIHAVDVEGEYCVSITIQYGVIAFWYIATCRNAGSKAQAVARRGADHRLNREVFFYLWEDMRLEQLQLRRRAAA